jgi:hypothetical protein
MEIDRIKQQKQDKKNGILKKMPVMQENPKRVVPTPSQQSATVAN